MYPRRLIPIALATLISTVSSTSAWALVTPMPLVPWDVPSTAVTLSVDGVAVPVGEWCPPGRNPAVRYGHFETDKPVVVTVTLADGSDLTKSMANNDRVNIKPVATEGTRNRTWTFTMAPGTKAFIRDRACFICATAPDPKAPKPGDAGVTNLADLGVKPDTGLAVTKALQAAIDKVAGEKPGPAGRVLYVPPGVYITGTLFMRDGVRMHLPAGAVLRGAEEAAEWLHHKNPIYEATSAMIFFGTDVETDGKTVGIKGASITGRGTIDGWGHFFRPEVYMGKPGNRPGFYEGDLTVRARLVMAMLAEDCRIEGVTLRNPTFWTTHIIAAKKFDFTDVRVYSNYRINNDGLNYDGCTDSTIDNCVMITGDDSACLKNEYVNGLGGPNRNIRMANSITFGFEMGVKFGWALHQIHDCVYENDWFVGGSFAIPLGRKGIRIAGPKIVEVTNVTIRNCVIDNELKVAVIGKAIDGYKLEGIVVEDCTIGNAMRFSNTTGLTLRRVTVHGVPIASAADLGTNVDGCFGVVIEGPSGVAVGPYDPPAVTPPPAK